MKIWTLKHDFCITDSDDYTSQIVNRPANVDDNDLDQPITPPQLASVPGVKQSGPFMSGSQNIEGRYISRLLGVKGRRDMRFSS